MKWLTGASVALVFIAGLCRAQATSWVAMPWAQRLAHAELIVSGTVTQGGVHAAEVRVEKIWKGQCDPVITVRGFADTFSANPRPLHDGDRCIFLLGRPGPERGRDDPSWACLNPYYGRFDVRGDKAYGTLDREFTQRKYGLAQVEKAIVSGLPPVTVEIKPQRDRLKPGEPLVLEVTVKNVHRHPVTLAYTDLRAATVYALISRPDSPAGDPATAYGSYTEGMTSVTRTPLTLRPGEAWKATRHVGTVEYMGKRIPFPDSVARVRLSLSLDKPPGEVWSNSVVVHVGP